MASLSGQEAVSPFFEPIDLVRRASGTFPPAAVFEQRHARADLPVCWRMTHELAGDERGLIDAIQMNASCDFLNQSMTSSSAEARLLMSSAIDRRDERVIEGNSKTLVSLVAACSTSFRARLAFHVDS